MSHWTLSNAIQANFTLMILFGFTLRKTTWPVL